MKQKTRMWVILALMPILFACFTSCGYPGDDVRYSIGTYTHYEWYTSGGFQDYTDYGKFYYDTVDFSQNRYFQKLTPSEMVTLQEHLDDFEGWVALHSTNDDATELVIHYDFDRTIIDCEDYLYMESELHTWRDGTTSLVNYNIHFFDTQSNTLYYFHNNI